MLPRPRRGFLHRRVHLIVGRLGRGTSGTGKSYFAEALANLAIEKDMRAAWPTPETLSATIMRSKLDGSIARTVACICGNDLIVVDDGGLLPVATESAEARYSCRCRIRATFDPVDSNVHPLAST